MSAMVGESGVAAEAADGTDEALEVPDAPGEPLDAPEASIVNPLRPK
jgi:hypothetical protein